MITTSTSEEAKKQLAKEPHPRIVKAHGDEFNRKLLEYGKFDILLNPEEGTKKDGFKTLDSGINHVIATIAHKNKVAFATDLAHVRSLSPKEKAQYLARIRQNLKLTRKAKVHYRILHASSHEEKAILLSLGASFNQTRTQSF